MSAGGARRRAIRSGVVAAIVSGAACGGATLAPARSPQADSLAIRRDIEYLASPALAGRLTGTPGNDSAAAFIARRYAALHLVALSPMYLQHFTARPLAHGGPGPSLPTQNVVAVLRGRDERLRNQYIVIGAHFDHLGASTEYAVDRGAHDAVRLGADDNASGTAAVLELARLLSASRPRRSIIFANFSAEEEGDLGSSYFTDHSPVPIDSIVAMLNFDMVGRLRGDKLIVAGAGTAAEFAALLDSANATTRLAITPQADGYGPSDHNSFYVKGIPVLHFFTNVHEDYHRATDVASKINAEGEARIVALAERVAHAVGDRESRPTLVRIAAPASMTSSREGNGSGAYLGSIPDMAASDIAGVRLAGVRGGSPAETAGLKAGDVIVELDGKPIQDLYGYSDALFAHTPGDTISIVVLRSGQRVTIKAVLGQR